MKHFQSIIFLLPFCISIFGNLEPNTIKAIDDEFVIKDQKVIRINILDNDKISGKISQIIVTPAQFGRAMLNLDNTVTYVPSSEFCGKTDNFDYLICNKAGCDTASINIHRPCESIIVLTGFSPNSESAANTFTIYGLENFEQYQLSVFNEFGAEVFTSNKYENDWRGDFNGVPLDLGLYFYVIETDKEETFNGYIQID